jgi:hypothetical protein
VRRRHLEILRASRSGGAPLKGARLAVRRSAAMALKMRGAKSRRLTGKRTKGETGNE